MAPPQISTSTTSSPEANAALLVHQIYLPGCFVVVQGIPGDGLANTIDTWPDIRDVGVENLDEADGDPNDQEEPSPVRSTMPANLEEDHFRRPQATTTTTTIADLATVPATSHDNDNTKNDEDANSDVLRASESTSTTTDAGSLVEAPTPSLSEQLQASLTSLRQPPSIQNDLFRTASIASAATSVSSSLQQQSSLLSSAGGLLQRHHQQQPLRIPPIMLNNPNAVVPSSYHRPQRQLQPTTRPARPPPPEDSFVVIATGQSSAPALHPSSSDQHQRRRRQQQQQQQQQQQALAVRQWTEQCRLRQRQQRRDWLLQEQHQHQQQQEQQRQQQEGDAAVAADHAFFLGAPTTTAGPALPRASTAAVAADETNNNPISSTNNNNNNDNNDDDDDWWLDPITGQLAILESLPHRHDHLPRPVVGRLAPGSTIVGTALWTLDSETLTVISSSRDHHNDEESRPQYHPPCIGCIQVLQLESPQAGYCVYSVNGYSFLLPGIANAYVDPNVWWWRVTCSVGAFVREGIDLSSNHVHTIPYGSLVQVTRKTVNRQGLSRLRVHAWLPRDIPDDNNNNKSKNTNKDKDTAMTRPGPPMIQAEGWCSEFLNPLSGQRGYVVQPLPFPVPATYRVTLEEGAVIRASVELSSPRIGNVPHRASVAVVGRAFSEHPQEKCLERLQLAGGPDAGWISVRLNKQPPHDCLVVELVGAEGRFDPNNPGYFHWHAQQRVRHQQQRHRHRNQPDIGGVERRGESSPLAGEISSIDDTTSGSGTASSSSSLEDEGHPRRSSTLRDPAPTYDAVGPGISSNNPSGRQHDRCLICLTEERNATIVHGETGHIACCLVCARILKARGDRCPVCRLAIDSVIQHFWA